MARERYGVQATLMQFFEERPGKTVYLETLARTLGEDPTAVQTGVRNLRRREGWEKALEVVVRGKAWRYTPTEETAEQDSGTGRCFEQIGTTRDGDLILQSDDGGIFRATEL